MLKTERKCNTITQLSNGHKMQMRVNNYKDGTVKKETHGQGVRYSATNACDSDLFSRHTFFQQCPALDWESDIIPILEQLNFKPNNIASCFITINQERCMQQFVVDNGRFTNDTLSTFIEIRLTIKTVNSILNIKRNVFCKELLDKDALKSAIQSELKKIDSQYSTFVGLDLFDVNPEEYEIILPAGTGGIYVHEALGHCLEGDLYFRKDNVLNGKLGHRITSNNNISVSDSCNSDDFIYYKMSDDGSIPKTITLIDKGYLENVMTDEYTMKLHGVDNTGNGRALDCFNFPIPRMRNTYIHNGNQPPEDIIQSTKKGIIATDILGGNVTTENGNFIFNVAHGLIVENGSIVGISNPFLFAGNIIQSLDLINAVGNDLSFVIATCGKGGQLINVSYGQPTIRIAKRK